MIIAAAHESSADWALFGWRGGEWSAITIMLKLKGRSRTTTNNIKIQMKSGLKTAYYFAEVKIKTINRNTDLKNMISAHKTNKIQSYTKAGLKQWRRQVRRSVIR